MRPLHIGLEKATQKIKYYCAYQERSHKEVRDKLYSFGLYKNASEKYNWNLDLKAIASIFRAGCIIQAGLLSKIMDAYVEGIENILVLPEFKKQVVENSKDLRSVVVEGMKAGLALPVFTSALTYLDQISTTSLGANVIQAQRDFFGAHTYQRIDMEGFEHHNWSTANE